MNSTLYDAIRRELMRYGMAPLPNNVAKAEALIRQGLCPKQAARYLSF